MDQSNNTTKLGYKRVNQKQTNKIGNSSHFIILEIDNSTLTNKEGS